MTQFSAFLSCMFWIIIQSLFHLQAGVSATSAETIITSNHILDGENFKGIMESNNYWEFQPCILSHFYNDLAQTINVKDRETKKGNLQTFINTALNQIPKYIGINDKKWVSFVQEAFTDSLFKKKFVLDSKMCTKVMRSKILEKMAFSSGSRFNCRQCQIFKYTPTIVSSYFSNLEKKYNAPSVKSTQLFQDVRVKSKPNDISKKSDIHDYSTPKRQIKDVDEVNFLPGDFEIVQVETNCNFNKHMQVLRTLGSGSFGTVSAVNNLKINGRIDPTLRAVKHIVYKGYLTQSAALNEVTILNRLKIAKAKNVIRLRSAWEAADKKSLYLLFDLYAGGSLQRFWNDPNINGLPLKKKNILIFGVLEALLKALKSVHEQALIIHGDLKPDNILVRKSAAEIVRMIDKGEDVSSEFHISDFGSSRAISNIDGKSRGDICTWWYKAPQMGRDEPYGVKQDIWSFGVITKQLLQNKFSNPLENSQQLKLDDPKKYMNFDGITQEFQNFIFPCLSETEEGRPSAQQLLTTLYQMIDESQIKKVQKLKPKSISSSKTGILAQ